MNNKGNFEFEQFLTMAIITVIFGIIISLLVGHPETGGESVTASVIGLFISIVIAIVLYMKDKTNKNNKS